MVGERYRDLLSAADSIVRMKNSSENLLERLEHARLESNRNRLTSKAQVAGKYHTRSITRSSQLSYILATLVRLLFDLSEHIWRSLEQEDFLTASRYQSLGRIISNELTSGSWDESGETEPREVIEMFPIVERQSETLGQLGPQISSRARLFLRKWEAKDQGTMEALAAVILLDTTSLLDSLELLLQIRKTAFNSLIARLNGSWIEIVKSAVKLLLATLENIHQIFLKGELTALLKAVQDGSSKENQLKPLLSLLPNAHQLMHFIPRSITNFCPFVAALAESEDLQARPITESWFQGCQLELISYIDKKLKQVQSTQILVELRQNLWEMIDEPGGPFRTTIERFGKDVLVSLNKRFYELCHTRLDNLKIEIIECLKQNDTGKTREDIKREDPIFDRKLPTLDPNDPTTFPKYLRSIQNRIEGKLVEEDEDDNHEKPHSGSTEGIVNRMEWVGKLLQEDFNVWEKDRGSLRSEGTDTIEQTNKYLDLGSQFVGACLNEIREILNHEIEQSKIEQELRVGDLAFQILSTRKSFMMNLSLQHGKDPDKVQIQSQFIQDFQAGLKHILVLSSRHWAQSVVRQAVLLFRSSFHNSYYSTVDESGSVTRPSEAMFRSLDYMSKSTMSSLGAHRIRIQQASLLETLVDSFILGILDEEFLDFVTKSKLDHEPNNQPPLDSILFDLTFLIQLFFGPRPSPQPSSIQSSHDSIQSSANVAREAINKVIDIILENEGEEGRRSKKERETSDHVRRFIATMVRLWWPIIPMVSEDWDRDAGEKKGSGGGKDADGGVGAAQGRGGPMDPISGVSSQPSPPLQDLNKMPKFAGLRCVKPGNRFALLSIQ